MLKRLFDIFLSTSGLILLAPIFLIIAIAIKYESAGPVFFRQIRVGRHEKLFRIFKFRSMVDGNKGSQITVQGDARVTRVGKFLRQKKLDELPQLINVFLGQMSLVGPRPEVAFYMDKYSQAQRDIILSVRPGITDFAAIELRHEEVILAPYADTQKAYVDILMPQKFALYKKYIEEQSLLLDVKLILKTVFAI